MSGDAPSAAVVCMDCQHAPRQRCAYIADTGFHTWLPTGVACRSYLEHPCQANASPPAICILKRTSAAGSCSNGASMTPAHMLLSSAGGWQAHSKRSNAHNAHSAGTCLCSVGPRASAAASVYKYKWGPPWLPLPTPHSPRPAAAARSSRPYVWCTPPRLLQQPASDHLASLRSPALLSSSLLQDMPGWI